jgi:ankyrin repeat protein
MAQTLYNYMKNPEISLEVLENLSMSQINNPSVYCDGLFTALEFDNEVGFKWLYRTLNDPPYLDFRDCIKDGETILMLSTKNERIFKFLRNSTYNEELLTELNKKNSEGDNVMTYLFRYFSDNNYIREEIIPLHPDLLNVNIYGDTAFSALILAACLVEDTEDYTPLIDEIIKQYDNILFVQDPLGNTPLSIPIEHDNKEIFMEMLQSVDEDYDKLLLHQNYEGNTLLHMALIHKANIEIIEGILIIAHEYDLLQQLLFIKNENGETVEFLYQSGDFKDDYRQTLNFLFKGIKPSNIEQKISEMLKYTQSKWNKTEKYWEKSKAFKNSNGNGTLYSVVDLEDVENKKYLEEDPGNLIFMLQNKDKSYSAFGYNIQGIMSSPNNELFFECRLQGNVRKSQYDYSSQNKFFSFSLQDPIFLKISFPVEAGQINKYILLENMIGALKSNERIFLIEKTEKTLLYSVAYHVAKGYLQNTEHNIVSADHCQESTDKLVSDIYICYEC